MTPVGSSLAAPQLWATHVGCSQRHGRVPPFPPPVGTRSGIVFFEHTSAYWPRMSDSNHNVGICWPGVARSRFSLLLRHPRTAGIEGLRRAETGGIGLQADSGYGTFAHHGSWGEATTRPLAPRPLGFSRRGHRDPLVNLGGLRAMLTKLDTSPSTLSLESSKQAGPGGCRRHMAREDI